MDSKIKIMIHEENFCLLHQKKVSWVRLRGPVIQANGRLTFEDDLRSGGLLCFIFNERQRPH